VAVSTSGPSPVSQAKVKLTPPIQYRPNAVYVTSGGKEVCIEFTEQGMYKPFFYTGGQLPEALDQCFTSKRRAHEAIVQYIMEDNVRGNAKWPEHA
jgi:hypothetical protein